MATWQKRFQVPWPSDVVFAALASLLGVLALFYSPDPTPFNMHTRDLFFLLLFIGGALLSAESENIVTPNPKTAVYLYLFANYGLKTALFALTIGACWRKKGKRVLGLYEFGLTSLVFLALSLRPDLGPRSIDQAIALVLLFTLNWAFTGMMLTDLPLEYFVRQWVSPPFLTRFLLLAWGTVAASSQAPYYYPLVLAWAVDVYLVHTIEHRVTRMSMRLQHMQDSLGAKVLYRSLPYRTRGMLFFLHGKPVIWINSRYSRPIQQLTLWHELTHLRLFHRSKPGSSDRILEEAEVTEHLRQVLLKLA